MTDRPLLRAGRWTASGGAVLEQGLAASLGLHVGDTIRLSGHPFGVAGIALTTEQPFYPASLPGLVWLTRAEAVALVTPAQPIGYVLGLKLADPATAPSFGFGPTGGIFGASSYGTVIVQPWQQTRTDDYSVIGKDQSVLLAVTWLLALLAIASIAVVVGSRMAEQTRRVGLLKAVGATPRLVALVLLAENLLLAIAAAIVGLVAGELIAPVLANSGSPLLGSASAPAVTATMVAEVIFAAVVVAIGATALPAIRGARASTIGSLNDAAQPPSRRPVLIALSARLPVPLLLGLRLAARRPRRTRLTVASLAIAVATVVTALAIHHGVDVRTPRRSTTGFIVEGRAPGQTVQLVIALSLILVILAAVNAIFITWTTVIDAQRPAALARAIGATPRQISAALTAAQLFPAVAACCLGIPAGVGLYLLIGGAHRASPPVLWLVAVPEAARVSLHREAAAALEAAGAPLTQVASQLILGAVAGDEAAAASLRRAAADAAPRSPEIAAELLRRAVGLLPDGDPEREAMQTEFVEALLGAGENAQAGTLASELLARPHDPALGGRLRFVLIVVLSLQGGDERLDLEVEAALQGSPEMPPAQQARLLGHSSFGRTFSGDFSGAERVARRALELADRGSDDAMPVWTMCALSTALMAQGRIDEGLVVIRDALHRAHEAPGGMDRMGNPRFLAGMSFTDADLFDEADQLLREAAVECETTPSSATTLPDVNLAAAQLRFVAGEWSEVVPELEGAIEFARARGNMVLLARARSYLALIAVARGALADAERALATAEVRFAHARPGFDAGLVVYAEAMLAEALGEPSRALELLRGAWELDGGRGGRYSMRVVSPALVRLCLEFSEDSLARDVAQGMEQAAALACTVPSVQSAAARCRGLIEHDPARMQEAVELARCSRRMLDLAATCEDAAAVLAFCDRTADAQVLASEAIDCYEALGAGWHAARAQRVAPGVRRTAWGSREPGARSDGMGKPHQERTGCRRARRGGADEPGDRQTPVHLAPHRQHPPAPLLPEARRQHPVGSRGDDAACVAGLGL